MSHTKEQAAERIKELLGDRAGHYDIDKTVESLHDYMGTYDFTDIDQNTAELAADEYLIEPLSEALAAHQAVQEAEQEVGRRVQARAQAIQEAVKSGCTQQEVADVLSVKQPRVAYMMKQGDKYQQ